MHAHASNFVGIGLIVGAAAGYTAGLLFSDPTVAAILSAVGAGVGVAVGSAFGAARGGRRSP